MSLKDHMGPKRNWGKKQWLEHAQVMVNSPWISEEDREYWKDKIEELL